MELVGYVTPPLIAFFVQSIKGHRGHEEARLGYVRLVRLGFVASVAFYRVYKKR